MLLTDYRIPCCSMGCTNEAVFKVAARWSDGLTGELKTYSLCCESCLAAEYWASRRKQADCRLAAGESLEVPGIYRLVRGQRDRDLQRLAEMELRLRANDASRSEHA
jgi:hypothetical protein